MEIGNLVVQNPMYEKRVFKIVALIFLAGVVVAPGSFVTSSETAFAHASTFAQRPEQRRMEETAECRQCAPGRLGLTALMNGDPDGAIKVFQQIETTDPDSPLGYLLDADANWWKIYLTTANLVDPDVFDVVYAKTSPYDSHFQELVTTAIQKSETEINAGREAPRNQLYEGLAYALRARLFGLRDNDLATARAAKKMRALLLAATKSDPSLLDADAGLGLYNYFVDTLPSIVKMLKFLVGLPGGNRELGLQQQQRAADHGEWVRAEAKFYLAKDYSRGNEKQYAKSLQIFQELSQEYPDNVLWKLLTGSLEIRLGRTEEGEIIYRDILAKTSGANSEIQKAFHHAAEEALGRLNKN